MYNKKRIANVVAISFLLVITVVAGLNFDKWFGTFSSKLTTDIDTERGTEDYIKINYLSDNSLYLISNSNELLNKIKIISGDGSLMCNFSNISNIVGSNDINISSCNLAKYVPYNILVTTSYGVFEETLMNN